jgi:hypothetical protein
VSEHLVETLFKRRRDYRVQAACLCVRSRPRESNNTCEEPLKECVPLKDRIGRGLARRGELPESRMSSASCNQLVIGEALEHLRRRLLAHFKVFCNQ